MFVLNADKGSTRGAMILSSKVRIVVLIVAALLIMLAPGHAPDKVIRQNGHNYSTWRTLPVGVYTSSRDLFKPARDAMNLFNEGFARSVFKLASKNKSLIRIHCTTDEPPRRPHARTYPTDKDGNMTDVRIYVNCKENFTDEVLRNLVAHELYHALGFYTPGLGHSYRRECISYPLAHEGQSICKEMVEDFKERYPVY